VQNVLTLQGIFQPGRLIPEKADEMAAS